MSEQQITESMRTRVLIHAIRQIQHARRGEAHDLTQVRQLVNVWGEQLALVLKLNDGVPPDVAGVVPAEQAAIAKAATHEDILKAFAAILREAAGDEAPKLAAILAGTWVPPLEFVLSPDLTAEQKAVFLEVLGDLFESVGGKGGLKIERREDLPQGAREFVS